MCHLWSYRNASTGDTATTSEHTNLHVQENLTREFDDEVENVLHKWFGKLSETQIAWARLPLKMGGLGLPSTHKLREASYNSSRYEAFEHKKIYSAQATYPQILKETHAPPDEENATEKKHNETIKKELSKNTKIARIMASTCQKGSYQWLQSTERYILSPQYTLAVMPRLGIKHPKLPSALSCPGCKIVLDPENALTHIPGCVRCSGTNSTTKHNALARYIYDLCQKAGIPCGREPREFSAYICSICNSEVEEERKSQHSKVCHGSTFRRSGPDLVIYWATGPIFYDLTVVHDLAPSMKSMSVQKAFRDAITRKETRYVASKLIPKEQFKCLPVLSSGAMRTNTKEVLQILAEKCGREQQSIQRDFTLHLQEINGAICLSQLRKYVAQEDGDNISF